MKTQLGTVYSISRLFRAAGPAERQPGFTGLEALESRALPSVTIANLSVTTPDPQIERVGTPVVVTVSGIVDKDPGSTHTPHVTTVKIYADTDNDPTEVVAAANEDILLGTTHMDAHGNAVLLVNTTAVKFPAGSYKIMAVVADNHKQTGFASADITVHDTAPISGDITVQNHNGKVAPNQTSSLLLAGAKDPDGKVTAVEFFVNKNNTGLIADSEDLGAGVQAGANWTLKAAVMPGDLVPGSTVQILAQLTDNDGSTSVTVLDNVPVAAAPTIGSFTATPNPVSLSGNASFAVDITGITDSDGTVVKGTLALDLNNNGIIDAGDKIIGSEANPPADIHTTLNTQKNGQPVLPAGVYQMLTVVVDNDGFSTTGLLTLTVVA